MLEYKKGTIIECVYYQQKVNPWTIEQHLTIRENEGKEYTVTWGISSNLDLFGEGDYVSFLADTDDDRILYIKNY